MPNWCECDLTVYGPQEKVAEFLSLAKSEESTFDFNRFVPYPEDWAKADEAAEVWFRDNAGKESAKWQERPKDGYNSGGHAWCIANWGTKWNARRVTHEPAAVWHCGEESTVAIQFETAWSPPLPIVKTAAELFPEIGFDLRYFECGMAFHGVFRCEGGEVVADECGPYYGTRGG